MLKALIVEDDLSLAKSLEEIVRREGLNVTVAHRASRASTLLTDHNFNLLILDRILPDGDGLDLIHHALEHHRQTRILVLTTQAQSSEVVRGLQLGASDYLAKPFNQEELILRLKNLLNQRKTIRFNVLTAGKLQLYPQSKIVIINGQEISLRPKQAELLTCLLEHQGLTLTKELILDQVWSDATDRPNYNTLAVYIRRLRMKLSPVSSRIQTIRGVGYRFI